MVTEGEVLDAGPECVELECPEPEDVEPDGDGTEDPEPECPDPEEVEPDVDGLEDD